MFIDKIYQCINEIANLNPERIAIYDGTCEYNYLQFKKGIDSCRYQLLSLQAQVNRLNIVGMYSDNSFVSHCMIYACALQRITYVPLSTADPSDRILTILNLADIKFIFFDQKFLKAIDSISFSLQNTDFQFVEIDTNNPSTILTVEPRDTSDLYILFTSGSTGRPKGVSIRHESVQNYLNWAGEYLKIKKEDIFLSHSRITFDLSVFNIFLPFMYGASAVLAKSLSDQAFPGELLKKNVTIALIVPRVTNLLMQSKQLIKNSFPTLRHILFCGEQLFAYQARAWIDTHELLTVHNIYGPTETTVTCTYYSMEPGEIVRDPIPIGKVIPNMAINFLDANNNLISAIEHEAEGIISGIGVSNRDYIGQDSDRFFNHERLGQSFRSGDILYRNSKNILFWRSRVDFQLKIRGYRVELSEIEIVLMSSTKINDAVCIYQPEKEKLHAFIESDSFVDNLETELRKVVIDKLPEYMHPAVYVFLPRLPKNQNGKVDRKKLFEICS